MRRGLEALAARHAGVIVEIRGLGMMLGIKTVPHAGEVVARLRERRLLAVPGGDNQVRLLPPLIVEDGHIDAALDTLDKVCADLEP